MEISRALSKYRNGLYDLYLYGYENGKFVKTKKRFKDYFFYKATDISNIEGLTSIKIVDPQTTYRSLYGDSLVKVEYTSKNVLNDIINMDRSAIFMADVEPVIKYMLNNGLKWSEYRNICYYDIETHVSSDVNSNKEGYDKDGRLNTPERAESPVTSIQTYISSEDAYYTFVWHPIFSKDIDDIQLHKMGNINVVLCKDERTTLHSFYQFIDMKNVDIMTGWFSDWYDMPYLIKRSKKIKLDSYKLLSPVRDVRDYVNQNGEIKIIIEGRDHVAFNKLLADMRFKPSNWKLNTIAEEVLINEDMTKMKKVTWRDWLDNFKGFIKYGIRDVEIIKKVDNKIEALLAYIHIQMNANVSNLTYSLYKSEIVDYKLITDHSDKYQFPVKMHNTKIKYKAAITLQPTDPGLHENIVLLDYASLYPTVTVAFNISPETYIVSQKEAEAGKLTIEEIISDLNKQKIPYIDTGYDDDLIGKRYIFLAQTSQFGILPTTLRTMYKDRKNIKEEMKKHTPGSYEYTRLDKKQASLKIILNSSYGAMAFTSYRLYKPECSDAITFFARKALLFAIQKFEAIGYKVLYGDTDSIFLLNKNNTIDKVNSDVTTFNNSLLEEFVKQYNPNITPEYMLMEIEYEKLFRYIYFGNVKKRYYGIDAKTNKSYVRGMNIIRKDAPKKIKILLNKLADQAVSGLFNTELLQSLREMLPKLDYKDVGVNKNFSKPFDQYKNVSQHVKASIWTNEVLNTNILWTDNPLLFYITEPNKTKKEMQIACCLKEEDLYLINEKSDLFNIDYDMLFDKQILSQIEEFDLLDSVKKAVHGYRELNAEFYRLYFNRHKRIVKKLDQNKKITKCELEWIQKYGDNFDMNSTKILNTCKK